MISCIKFVTKHTQKPAVFVWALFLFAIPVSCKKMLETDLDNSRVLLEKVYNNDENAIAAVRNIYSTMVSSAFFGGGSEGLTSLTGLTSDELYNFEKDPAYLPFEENNILADNSLNYRLWSQSYKIIYLANDVLEGVSKSSGLSKGVKDQLLGEAYFVRGLCHFYLVNLFGEIPVVLTNDYRINSTIQRMDTAEVYHQIVDDLIIAESLLSEDYPESEKVRPNRSVAQALLARVYLYSRDWKKSEELATFVLDKPEYQIETDLNKVFLKESAETIWQLASEVGQNTNESYSYVIDNGINNHVHPLRSTLQSSFDTEDFRLRDWVKTLNIAGTDIHIPFKYKADKFSGSTTEYTVLFRRAEQFLIRAEARTQQGDLTGAISDIDTIRQRANLSLIGTDNPGIAKADMLLAIENERLRELFKEGHRWFDLNRTGRTMTKLETIKPDWSINDVLYPIPRQERLDNPNLGSQNPGY